MHPYCPLIFQIKPCAVAGGGALSGLQCTGRGQKGSKAYKQTTEVFKCLRIDVLAKAKSPSLDDNFGYLVF